MREVATVAARGGGGTAKKNTHLEVARGLLRAHAPRVLGVQRLLAQRARPPLRRRVEGRGGARHAEEVATGRGDGVAVGGQGVVAAVAGGVLAVGAVVGVKEGEVHFGGLLFCSCVLVAGQWRGGRFVGWGRGAGEAAKRPPAPRPPDDDPKPPRLFHA